MPNLIREKAATVVVAARSFNMQTADPEPSGYSHQWLTTQDQSVENFGLRHLAEQTNATERKI
jgi:hypothetical protein